MTKELTHLNQFGEAHMVDVGAKPHTAREAVAQAVVHMCKETLALILANGIQKGEVFACARIAGIMAAKRTGELIPLCHPLPLSAVELEITASSETEVTIIATTRCVYHTGVEMEAMIAASVAALTIYDMCKAVDRSMQITSVQLLKKSGGKSGTFVRDE